ncbi:MAG: sulfotransferase [Promethearchaeota archaeon]
MSRTMKPKKIKQKLGNTAIIVSGLPRSGTSMMMQMLKDAGVEILADEKRKADRNNPKGYLELQAIKKLDKDNSCLKNVEGKAVKVISHLLEYLPEDKNYKIIFMDRNMDEIIQSQQKMLKKELNDFPSEVVNAFKKEIKNVELWVEENDNIEMIRINYSDVIREPEEQVQKILDFLDLDLNKRKMVEVVDPDLYRNRAKKRKKNK